MRNRRVTESLLALVPRGRVLALDASSEMVDLARSRLGDRAEVWCQDVLALELAEPVNVLVSTATLHWITDHDRMWARLAGALRPGGSLEVQCGGAGNLARVRKVIETVAADAFPELVGFSPWEFATPEDTERRVAPRRLCVDPVLATRATNVPGGSRPVDSHLDLGGASRPPPRAAPRTFR